ncbi:MAG TPA: metallophosphoesterase [Fimbriimonas sp.]
MFSRRRLLAMGGACAASLLPVAAQGFNVRGKSRALRIAHLTDLHVQPERKAALGMERCLELAQSHDPDVIFLGGDMVMDCFHTDLDRARKQWDLFQSVLKSNTRLPVYSVIGNHDIWGWGLPEPDIRYGKKMAMDRLGMDKKYYSFDKAGWHFVMLDSVRRLGRGYRPTLDEAQFQWLKDDLAKTPPNRPVFVMSHIPILTTTQYFFDEQSNQDSWKLPSEWMHLDARRIKDLFKKHRNVKGCVAGHMHMVDQVDYLGVKYFCNGAVAGRWWRGPMQEFGNGCAIIDLYGDGSMKAHYKPFDWVAA